MHSLMKGLFLFEALGKEESDIFNKSLEATSI